MRKYFFLTLILGVFATLFFHSNVEAGNTNIGLIILGTGSNGSGGSSTGNIVGSGTSGGNISGFVLTGNVGIFGGGSTVPVGIGANTIPIHPADRPQLIPIGPLILPPVDTSSIGTNTNSQGPVGNGGGNPIVYDTELKAAYDFAKSVGITTTTSIETARIYDPITRGELAKMIVQYIKNEKKQTVPLLSECAPANYTDMTKPVWQSSYVQDICSLKIMGRQNDGKMILDIFRPDSIITRAELSTVLSRYLYGPKYMGDTTDTYYTKHLQALFDDKIMTKIDNPDMKEIRGYVMIMLQRLQK